MLYAMFCGFIECAVMVSQALAICALVLADQHSQLTGQSGTVGLAL